MGLLLLVGLLVASLPLAAGRPAASPCAPIRTDTGAPCGNYTLGFNNSGVFSIDTLESSLFRFHGQLYMLEGIGCVFGRVLWENKSDMDPAFANTSYFRIREVGSGRVVVNIPGSQGFGFPNASVDYDHERLWVFGTPQDRCHAHSPGPSIHSWRTTDLRSWASATVAGTTNVTTPNLDVARVRMSPAEAAARGLPPHRYIMILEGKGPTHNNWDWSGGPEFMLSNAQDGNLLEGWVSTKFLITNHSKHVLGCPSIRYQDDGYYYAVTGMGIWNGIARSRNLQNWTYGRGTGGGGVPTLANLSLCLAVSLSLCVCLCRCLCLCCECISSGQVGDWWLSGGLVRPTAKDGQLGPFNQWLAANVPSYWDDLVAPRNLQQWDGHSSDPDVCCDDDPSASPSYIVWGVSNQGGSSNSSEASCFNNVGQYDGTLTQFLSSYFE